MSKIMQVTATQARNQFFDLINAAHYGQQITQVVKNGVVVAQIVPAQQPFDWKAYKKRIKKIVGMFTEQDYEDMKAARQSLNTPRFPEW